MQVQVLDIFRVVLTSTFSVVGLFLLTKLMGNRQMSQLSMFDYINGITIGSISAEICYSEDYILPTIAMVVYATFSILVSYLANKSIKYRRFFNGTPLVLFDKGKFNVANFKKSRLDLNELLSECRTQGYFNVDDLQTILLETNGKVSVLPKSSRRPVNPDDLKVATPKEVNTVNVIVDGTIISDNLKLSGKNDVWLHRQLKLQHIRSTKDVFLAFCDGSDSLSVYKY